MKFTKKDLIRSAGSVAVVLMVNLGFQYKFDSEVTDLRSLIKQSLSLSVQEPCRKLANVLNSEYKYNQHVSNGTGYPGIWINLFNAFSLTTPERIQTIQTQAKENVKNIESDFKLCSY